jgi:hypothetical protein
VDDEIAFHLQELARELEASHPRRPEWLSELWQDLRFGIRQARRQPAFTLTLLLVLSLRIGAHTAIVTAFHAVLLRPLPYHDAGQLVHSWETAPHLQGGRSEASFPDFEDWQRETRDLFAGIEGYDGTNMVLTGRGPARMMQGGRVTAGFLRLLGVRPAIGRDLRIGEDIPGGSPVVVVSHGFWLREFGGDTAALGRSLVLNGGCHEESKDRTGHEGSDHHGMLATSIAPHDLGASRNCHDT